MSGRSAFLGLLVAATFIPPVVVLAVAAGGVGVLPPLFVALTLLITLSLGHVPATLHLVASDPEARRHLASRPGVRIGVPLAFVLAMPLTMALVSEAGASFLLLAFLAYQMWHFGRQNLGVLAFAAIAARSAPLSSAERATMNAATVAGMLSVTNPAVFSVQGFKLEPLLTWFPPLRSAVTAVHGIGFVFYVVLIVAVIAVWMRRRPQRSVPETMLYLGSLVFFVPVYLSTAPLVAFWSYGTAHAMQYLLFLGYHATGWSYGLGRNPPRRWPWGVLGLASLVIFAVSVHLLLSAQQSLAAPVGAAIDSATEWLGNGPLSNRAVVRAGLGVALGVTLAHFWLDQHLWRLRDPSRRAWVRDRYAFLFSREAPAAACEAQGTTAVSPTG